MLTIFPEQPTECSVGYSVYFLLNDILLNICEKYFVL